MSTQRTIHFSISGTNRQIIPTIELVPYHSIRIQHSSTDSDPTKERHSNIGIAHRACISRMLPIADIETLN